MPTGYTAAVCDGEVTDLADFVLTCARAFGAAIHQRDDSPNSPLRLPTVSDYYPNDIARVERELAEVQAWTDDVAAVKSVEDYERRLREISESKARHALQTARLQAMRRQVQAWTPPTPDHVRLKEFMLQQIETSMPHELDGYWTPPEAPESGPVFKAKRVAHLTEWLARSRASYAEEVDRVEQNSQWLTDLAASVGREVTS